MRASCLWQAVRFAGSCNRGWADPIGQAMRSPSCRSISVSALCTRSAISPAAFSVNVTRTMRSGSRFSSVSSSRKTSATIAVVLPVPAPASMTRFRWRTADWTAEGGCPPLENVNDCCWLLIIAQQRPRILVSGYGIFFGVVVLRAAGVIHGAVRARIEFGVLLVRKCREAAGENRGSKNIERLAQTRGVIRQVEAELRVLAAAQRLD